MAQGGTVIGEKYAVIGLGYVGLPVAVGFARAHGEVVGFDISQRRVDELARGDDATREFAPEELRGLKLRYTSDPAALADRSFFIVTVPTPIDGNHQPDLAPLRAACATIGAALRPGAVVVFESTVYPGLTEEVCAPLLARISGLEAGRDFGLGYSPERINPGDREHRLENIVKVVSGSDGATLERVVAAYGPVVTAGLHVAPSIKVAEAAKVIENTQRDLNIALMNELAIIFERLGIRTRDVMDAAASKWNFLPFSPGLVGGHCIGVDPYYLTAKAETVGYHPEVILAGRRINDGMGAFVARKLVKLLIASDVPVRRARVGILGLTFKEDVPDLRNSRVPDILRELGEFGIKAIVHDPLADPGEVQREYGLELAPLDAFRALDALVLAVPHRAYRPMLAELLPAMLDHKGVVVDVKSALDREALPPGVVSWSL
ncbi:nucleotide sugar dehydrogenase [Marinimicrococcus flavescens]|uniref:Nucleotide sugar dehydrogenase n=1 Tax=Marinimicrococcus flavescens TaxID=3031815 RepID=A0AAP3V022_9PROT|nr:nucleotide sugar dehydrogenase [Marinimicrococcus flavescens]